MRYTELIDCINGTEAEELFLELLDITFDALLKPELNESQKEALKRFNESAGLNLSEDELIAILLDIYENRNR
ncbi:MAG: hypothetical protein C0602_06180 [Denitrovibrio sp.]|nr:MAG: hypothetical protein C0602_06180 [Denitrovibrio sp.]